MIAVIALTERAARLGERIISAFSDARLWIHLRHQAQFQGAQIMEDGFSAFVAKSWNRYSRFIFIMASGVVVRTVAPLLRDKTRDPGIVVMDENGKFAIPLVSGHLGGANALARELGARIGCVPVITTASDVNGIPSLDDLARQNHCALENLGGLKEIAVSMLENRPIVLYSTVAIDFNFPPNVRRMTDEDALLGGLQSGVIFITEKETERLPGDSCPYVILRPPNIIAGVGCKKGKSSKEIIDAILSMFKQYRINPASLAHIVTIDVKKDEPGLVEAAGCLRVPLKWVSREAVKKVQKLFPESAFVKEKIGVGAVAEPTAWLTAKKPRWISRKTCHDGVTVALVKDEGVVLQDKKRYIEEKE